MLVRKSIVLNIDSDVSMEFRMKTIAEDKPIGEIVSEWIQEYLQEEDDEE